MQIHDRGLEKDTREDTYANAHAQKQQPAHSRMASQKLSKIGPKWSLEGLRGGENELLELSGAPGAPMWAKSGPQERSKSLLGAARGPKTIHRTRPGAPKSDWSPITSIRGRPGVDFGLRLGGPGAPRSILFEICFKCCVFSKKKDAHSLNKTLIFEARGVENGAEMASTFVQNRFSQQVGPKTALKRS